MQLCEGITSLTRDKADLLRIETPYSTAEISLFGGHVLSFTPKVDQRDRLWVSNKAIFDNQKAIRGGIPVCWPWFSDAHRQERDDLPSHGFVRTQKWKVIEAFNDSGSIAVKLIPESVSGPGWHFDTPLTMTLNVGKTLKISLSTQNRDTKPVALNCALHTYFGVDDISEVELTGLSGLYRDKTQNWLELETPAPYKFSQETDRVHLNAAKQVLIQSVTHSTKVLSSGHDSIVVWNPWAQNSEKMQDMENAGYQGMLCVETALTQPFSLAPGEEHVLTQEIV